MKSTPIADIKISTSKRPKSRFNLPFDVNTTFSWGEIQPLVSRIMYPGDKNSIDISSLVRLAPLVRPTFGRIKYKTWSQFVDMEDIFPEFPGFMARSKGYVAGVSQFPNAHPYLPLCFLSAMCLIGAKATAYIYDTSAQEYRTWKVSHIPQDAPSSAATLLSDLFGQSGMFDTAIGTIWNGKFTGPSLDLKTLWSHLYVEDTVYPGTFGNNIIQVLETKYGFSVDVLQMPSAMKHQNMALWYSGKNNQYENAPLTNVALDKADAVVPFIVSPTRNPVRILVAFRFSSFGVRLFKILKGLGAQFNLTSQARISLLPFLAFSKAYWDVFGLSRYKNWRETAAYRLIDCIRTNRLYGEPNTLFKAIMATNATGRIADARYAFQDWIYELANSWVTDSVDFVSAHTSTLNTLGIDGVDSPIDDAGMRYIDTAGFMDAPLGSGSSVGDYTSYLPSASITLRPFLSGLSVDVLMRLYRWTNKLSVAGREIANILKSQGYGYYVYSCKSNFIGSSDEFVQITDVTSTADTYKDGEGALLADYAGKGVQYTESRVMTFETDKFGFWITLAAIVPDAGYNQGIDSNLLAITKAEMYNPEFDSLGMEARSKAEIVGEESWPSQMEVNPATFGFAPRYFGIKSVRNIANGEFSLGHKKDDLLPYELDRYIPLGERYVGLLGEDSVTLRFEVIPMLKDIPVAGDEWRYISRYPWLGYFERIFANANRDAMQERLLAVSEFNDISDSLAFIVQVDDNFMTHNVVNLQSWRNMLPISESFGTGDGDEFNSGFDASLAKS